MRNEPLYPHVLTFTITMPPSAAMHADTCISIFCEVTVTIRNPWGKGDPLNAAGKPRDGKDDGVFTMSLDEFQQTFSDVAYGQKERRN